MAERIRFNHEHRGVDQEAIEHRSPEQKEKTAAIEELERRANNAAEKSNDEKELLLVDQASKAANDSQSFNDRLKITNEPPGAEKMSPTGDLKKLTYARNLYRVQKRLTKSDRIFSKVTHNKYVDFASSGVASTLGRQYGLLGAGVVGFFGSLYLYRTASMAGFEYNFFAVFGLFAIGYVVGECVELVIKIFFRRPS